MSISDWRINFFDLGVYTGEETALFLEQMESLREGRESPVVCAYLFEAYKPYVRYATERFANDPRVFVKHAAIGSANGSVPLYLGQKPEGHSLYSDKHDVGKGASYFVPEIRFSDWFTELGFREKTATTVNVIKANIEGAEWDLIEDMEQAGLFPFFDIFLGTDQWTTDMRKCHSLLSRVAKAKMILASHGVTTLSYCCGTENYPNVPSCVDLAIEVRKAVEERSLVEA
jgi:hypothetical protein